MIPADSTHAGVGMTRSIKDTKVIASQPQTNVIKPRECCLSVRSVAVDSSHMPHVQPAVANCPEF